MPSLVRIQPCPVLYFRRRRVVRFCFLERDDFRLFVLVRLRKLHFRDFDTAFLGFFDILRARAADLTCFFFFGRDLAAAFTTFFAFCFKAGNTGCPAAAALPAKLPTTPPIMAPAGPAKAPMAAPAIVPAVSFRIGGISMFSLAGWL